MRWILSSLLLSIAGCGIGLPCEQACEQTRDDDCAAADMPACDVLCADLRAEASTAGCDDEWADLESCMGEDPVCMGASRCGEELAAHGACIDTFCSSDPSACTP